MTSQAITPYSVMIVDDSAAARALLRRIVETDPRLRVMACLGDAQSAALRMKTTLPDVMLLDIDMPGINGLAFLRKIMSQRPLPVIICSSHTVEGSELGQMARAAGALDVVEKPLMTNSADFERARTRICNALCDGAAGPPDVNGPTSGSANKGANAGVQRPVNGSGRALAARRLSPDEIMPRPAVLRPAPLTAPIVCLGASTGGTEALRQVLTALPADAPALTIVLHMPAGFTKAFAQRMDGLSSIEVREALGGETLRPCPDRTGRSPPCPSADRN